jgi:2-desacetyl-2-hydroxyethyl bacteriochlorophyllide A dehydrogenase
MTTPPASISARALWLTASRTAEFRDEPVPPPGPGEVRIRTIASAFSQGTELLVYRGDVPPDLPLDLPTLAGSFAFPIKYGYATVGRVVDAGNGVEEFAPGDLVFVHHPHQSAYVVPATMPVRLPPDLDPLCGLFVANLETAINVLLDTPLHLGETVIIFGQGTVGLLIAQLLKRAGAGCVLAVDPMERRRDVARRIGVDQVLPPSEDLPTQVRMLTAGRGADIVVEASGAAAALQAAIDSLAIEGTVIAVSWYGVKPVTLALGGHFHRGRVRLRSSQVGRINPDLAPRWDRDRRLALAVDLLSELRLTELISHRIPFHQAPDAYRLVDEHPDQTLQVVLLYDNEHKES